MDKNQNLIANDLVVDHVSHIHLKETASWAKFLGIVGFVISIFIMIAAFFAGSIVENMDGYGGEGNPVISAGLVMGIYLAGGGIYFLMSLYLFRFAVRMKTALASSSQDNLNDSFKNLKFVYRIIGIITLVYIGIFILGMVIGLGVMMN